MMISTKGRYALRVLVDMAEHQAGGCYVPLREIAARQEISEKYLESIVKLLVHENILLGVRGKGGGYQLNGEPDQFTVRRILEITEGSLAPVACLAEPHTPCARSSSSVSNRRSSRIFSSSSTRSIRPYNAPLKPKICVSRRRAVPPTEGLRPRFDIAS